MRSCEPASESLTSKFEIFVIFRPASEAFKDPNAFDFLSQHGGRSGSTNLLARESLYVKFDPLIAGRPSILQQHNQNKGTTGDNLESGNGEIPSPTQSQQDLIAMNSPSPKKPASEPSLALNNLRGNDLDPISTPSFNDQLQKKETQIANLQAIASERNIEIDRLREESKKLKDSEDQMKQVLMEYEKTISELIAEKEKEKCKAEEERQASVKNICEEIRNMNLDFYFLGSSARA